jgi:HPt (histidine-containing phosphotransfer) domain-containing protein
MEPSRIVAYVDPDLADLIPGYLNNRRKDLVTLKDALNRSDLECVWRIGHCMKGNGASYGFDAISTLGADLERAGKTQDVESIGPTLMRLEAYLEQVEVVYRQENAAR